VAKDEPASLGVRDFARQSVFSSPGPYRTQARAVPAGVPGICTAIQGILVHYRSPELRGLRLPRRRRAEPDLRYADAMLARILELDARPLDKPRPASKRLIGCCRDFALLFCTLAREQGIPARIRVGFASYFRGFPDGFHVDHTIGEYWDARRGRWVLVDAEQTPRLVRENRLTFSPLDIPRDKFWVGGKAWQEIRSGSADPENFAVDPGQEPGGAWFVRSRLLLDLAALNRTELLLWDAWKATGPAFRPSKVQLVALDRMASDLAREEPPLPRVRHWFRVPTWRPGSTVWKVGPISAPRRERLRTALPPGKQGSGRRSG
jgi:hypothetical protein